MPEGPPGLLHNDFKLNNMILDPDDFSPRAVVDWDQGTRGDPLFDFATLLSYWLQQTTAWAMHDMEQMPAVEACLCPRQEAVAEYAKDLRPRHVQYSVSPCARDVQIVGDLPSARSALPQRRDAEPRYAPLTAIGTGILEFTHEIAQGRAF